MADLGEDEEVNENEEKDEEEEAPLDNEENELDEEMEIETPTFNQIKQIANLINSNNLKELLEVLILVYVM